MQLFEFLIPTHMNNGRSYEQARKAFEAACVLEAGGVSILPIIDGRWNGPDGRHYKETMVPYRVGCDGSIADKLISKALALFDDQISIAVSIIGNMTYATKEGQRPGLDVTETVIGSEALAGA